MSECHIAEPDLGLGLGDVSRLHGPVNSTVVYQHNVTSMLQESAIIRPTRIYKLTIRLLRFTSRVSNSAGLCASLEKSSSWRAAFIFRSTPPSRPNKAGLDVRLYVRTSVRACVGPQKVFRIRMKFGVQVEVDECCTPVCRMTRSKVKVTRL